MHDNQESTSQLRLEKVFDQGALSIAYLDNRRQFYRDTISASTETTNIRFAASALAQPQAGTTASGALGLPWVTPTESSNLNVICL